MARLQEVLDRPAGRSRHEQVAALARERAAGGQAHDGVITKAVAAVAEPVEDTPLAGTFEAIVSDFLPDRQLEAFTPDAWTKALDKIRRAGRSTPVLFGHSQSSPAAVLGAVPPDGWRVTPDGLIARGWIDTTDSVGSKVFRMIKSGALQWSVGFTLTKRRPGRAGVTELTEVNELLELSCVAVPANERTRTLSAKSDDPDREPPSLDELRAREAELGLDPESRRLRAEMRHLIMNALTGTPPTRDDPHRRNGSDKRAKPETLKQRANRIEREHELHMALNG